MKKKMLGIISCVLALLCALACVGCGGDNGPGGGKGKVTLNVWIQTVNQPQFFTWAAKRYKELNPNVTVSWKTQAGSTLGQTLDATLGGNNGPDITATWGGLIVPKLVKGKRILKLNDVITSEVEAKLNDSAKINKIDSGSNEWYSLPLSGFASPVIFYNKTVFDEKQWTVPTTYDELKTLAANVKKAGKAPIVSGFGDWQMSHFMMAMHGRTMTDTNLNGLIGVNTEKNPFADASGENPVAGLEEGFELLKQYKDDGLFADNMTGYSVNTAQSYFTGGSALMYAAPSLEYLELSNANFEIGAFVLPAAPDALAPAEDKPASLLSGVYSDVFVVNAKTKNPDACKEFMRFLLSDEAQAKLLENFLFPSVNGISTETLPPRVKPIFESVLGTIYSDIQTVGCTPFYQSYSIGQMDGRLASLGQGILGKTTPAAAAAELVSFYQNSGVIK